MFIIKIDQSIEQSLNNPVLQSQNLGMNYRLPYGLFSLASRLPYGFSIASRLPCIWILRLQPLLWE